MLRMFLYKDSFSKKKSCMSLYFNSKASSSIKKFDENKIDDDD
jgi:hypothetical protein